MSENIVTAALDNPFEGHPEIVKAWHKCKALMKRTGRGLRLIAFVPQSREQQCTYHSALADLARDCLLAGERRDEWTWKRSTLCAFYEATRRDPDFVDEWEAIEPVLIPRLDGDGFNLELLKSRCLSHGLAGAYLAFLHATGDQRGVTWSPTSLGRQPEGQPA